MSYIKDNLMKDETIVFEAKPHWIIFCRPVFWLAITFFLLAVSPIFFPGNFQLVPKISFYKLIAFITLCMTVFTGLSAYIDYVTIEFAATTKRVLLKTGLIRRNTLEIMLPRIEGISVNQSVLGRLLDYGTLLITGIGGSKDVFNDFPNPVSLRNIVQEQVETSTAFSQKPTAFATEATKN